VQVYYWLIENTNHGHTVYRALIQFLKTEIAEYHTYKLKEDKTLRVVIRNLNPSTPLTPIKYELEVRCFEVRQVTNVLHKVRKTPFHYSSSILSQHYSLMQFSNFHHYFILKLKLKSHINQKKSANISTANNTNTPEHTVDAIPAVFVVEQIIIHQSSACRIHKMSLQNAFTVPKANYKGC